MWQGLRLIDEGVSRRHAALVKAGDRILIKELESANGTHGNGVRGWNPVFLEDGDEITLGGTTILVVGRHDGSPGYALGSRSLQATETVNKLNGRPSQRPLS